MKALPWIVAGAAVAAAMYVIVKVPSSQYSSDRDDVEKAANRANILGTKQRVGGTGRKLAGKLKEGIGRASGADKLAGEGLVDQAVGGLKDTAGEAANAISDTIHDLNRS